MNDIFIKIINPRQETIYPLKEGENYIGRKSENPEMSDNKIDLDIQDPEMSRVHCLISIEKNFKGECTFFLQDANSANGTCLLDFKKNNLHKVDKIYLKNRDEIKIGNTIIQFNFPYTTVTPKVDLNERTEEKSPTVIWKNKV